MIRSIQRVALAAIALSLVAAAPASAAGPGNTVVTKTATTSATTYWETPYVVAADGSTSYTAVSVAAFIDFTGTPVVRGDIATVNCPFNPEGTVEFLPCTAQVVEFAGAASTFTVNRTATLATVVGKIPTVKIVDFLPVPDGGSVVVNITLTASSAVSFPSAAKSNYRGYVYVGRTDIAYSESAAVTGTVGGLNAANQSYSFNNISLGSSISIANYGVRKY